MNPQNTKTSLDQQDPQHKAGYLPIAAFFVSILGAFFIFILIFIYSDPSGDDIGFLAYSLMAINIGLVGIGAIYMAGRSIKNSRPYRNLSIVTICIGSATILAVGAFFLVKSMLPLTLLNL